MTQISRPPRVLTEPLARLLASELGLEWDDLPELDEPVRRDGIRRTSKPLCKKELRLITRKLLWADRSQKVITPVQRPLRKSV